MNTRFTAFSTATPDEVWAHFADVSRWPTWDEHLEQARLEGPFAVGTEGQLTVAKQAPLGFVLTEVTNGHMFTTETRLGPVVVTLRHRLERLFGGCRIVHELEVRGPDEEGWTARLSPAVQHAVERLGRLTSSPHARFGGVILYTRDVAQKASFYQRAFGFEVESRGAVPVAFAAESFIEQTLPVDVRRARPTELPAAGELMFVFADVSEA